MALAARRTLMRHRFCSSLKLLMIFAWVGVIVSYLTYDYFVSSMGLREPPCPRGSSLILWRSTHYCATHSQARLWNLNHSSLYVLLIAAVALSMAAGACVQNYRAKVRET